MKMKKYQARNIEFKETIEIEDWSIKIYTITKDGNFNHPVFYEQVKSQLPEWLLMENSFNSHNYKVGFLILHSATEGIFSLINWWIGENMLNSHIFMTDLKEPENFTKISGDGLVSCVWELEIMNHERISWLNNILKQAPNPNYPAYLDDVYNGII